MSALPGTSGSHATLAFSLEVLHGPGGWIWRARSTGVATEGRAHSQTEAWMEGVAWLVEQGELPAGVR